eukprot:m.214679 g.214679  ORF g.214679 m.214679 type:complete len:328 (+) comp27295_c0_seq1:224-1207(+)
MAKSKFEYVKRFERDESLLPNTWLVLRVDGRAFHKFTKTHNFAKPNDSRALDLMNGAAKAVMTEFRDIVLAYGESDEYSFVFRKSTSLWNRRSAKILTSVVSYFTANYVMLWQTCMRADDGTAEPLQYPPQFDGRMVCYPSLKNLRDYLSWRQADCHINNLYNTCFWTLVQDGGKTPLEAEGILSKTLSKDKNELLFSEFNVNYNNEPAMFRRGSLVLWHDVEVDKVITGAPPSRASADGGGGTAADPSGHITTEETRPPKGKTSMRSSTMGGSEAGADTTMDPQTRHPIGSTTKKVKRKQLVVVHDDVIGDAFWEDHTDIFPLEGA